MSSKKMLLTVTVVQAMSTVLRIDETKYSPMGISTYGRIVQFLWVH